jgi:hypothetical protein
MKSGYISYLIEVLTSDDFYGASETIEIAKGKYYLPTKFGDVKNQMKRTWRRK